MADPQAQAAWAGMQLASARTSAMVSYLPAVGDGTAGSAATYVATEASQHCGLVVTVGAAQVQAVALVACRFPATQFVEIGAGAAGSNVTVLNPEGQQALQGVVADAVQSAFDAWHSSTPSAGGAADAAPCAAASGAPSASAVAASTSAFPKVSLSPVSGA